MYTFTPLRVTRGVLRSSLVFLWSVEVVLLTSLWTVMYVGKRGRFATRLESSEQLQQQTVNKKTTIEIGYSYNKKMMVQ